MCFRIVVFGRSPHCGPFYAHLFCPLCYAARPSCNVLVLIRSGSCAQISVGVVLSTCLYFSNKADIL
jgi:hypothetical protein